LKDSAIAFDVSAEPKITAPNRPDHWRSCADSLRVLSAFGPGNPRADRRAQAIELPYFVKMI
jgi:hypothetical protein